MLLSLSPIGELNRIKAIWADDDMKKVLKEAGIAVDDDVFVILRTLDALIIKVNGKRIAIGEELARKIIV